MILKFEQGTEEWVEKSMNRIRNKTKKIDMFGGVSLNGKLLIEFPFMKKETINFYKLLEVEYEGIDSIQIWIEAVYKQCITTNSTHTGA